MRHTLRRRFRLWWLPLVVLATVHGQDKPLEAPAPVPTTAVQQLLDEAAVASNDGDAAKALGLADQALVVAQPAADAAGQALAQRVRASQLAKLDRNGEAQAAWREAETAWKRIGDGPGQVEALGWQAILEIPGNAPQGTELLQRAIALAETETRRPLAVVSALGDLGRALVALSLLGAAHETYHAGVAIAERIVPGSLELASGLSGLGSVAYHQGDLSAARDYYQASLTIREKLAPNSLTVAASFNSLGLTAFRQGDLVTARDYHQRALAIREKLAPDSLAVAWSFGNLSNVANEQGDLAVARDYGERALAITAKLAPNSRDMAGTLGDLGNVVSYQGDLSAARGYHERALAIFEKLAPNSLDVAIDLNNLGMDARNMGDLAAAREYHERALKIRETLAPNSLAVASSLKNLGFVALDQGNLIAARDYEERALEIRETLAPSTLLVAEVLDSLGEIARAQRDLRAARDYHEHALAIGVKLAPNSIYVFGSLADLGALAYEQGDRRTARDYHERALAMGEKLAPNSLDVAEVLKDLSSLAYDDGNLGLAARESARAWGIIRTQAAFVAGDEARQAFESRYQAIGGQLVRFQVALGHTDEAFVTLEEGRAQGLLQLLAERGIARRLAPAEVWRPYELALAASNRAEQALENAGAAEANATLVLQAEIAQQRGEGVLQEKRRLVSIGAQQTEQTRAAYTRARVETERRWADVAHAISAALPAPLGAAEARRALSPATILAAFVVGDDACTLFIVRRDGPVQAFPLALPPKVLAARVAFVRKTVSRQADERGIKITGSDEVRVNAARSLYQELFPTAAREAIGNATRLLLSPDGVLWDLPFAALVMNDQGPPQYLGLEKPLTYAQSLAVFAQSAQAARLTVAPERNVLVIGNPLFDNALRRAPSSSGQNPVAPAGTTALAEPQRRGELALLSRNGETPAPLPYAEEEARQVAALYGVRASTATEPTEAWFRQRAVDADIIHLATHGYFNPLRAVSSGLRLAVPEVDPAPGETDNDGALQAWEVFQLKLRANLVVLSACETGVGAKVAGEGLVGLTRAFQVAGVASIVATQWSVSDHSTARGMVAFHQHLLQGLSKDEALRQAMRTLAADPTTADPHYWAPFVLVGDFRPLRTSVPR